MSRGIPGFAGQPWRCGYESEHGSQFRPFEHGRIRYTAEFVAHRVETTMRYAKEVTNR
jgi:hypothetical protein